MIKKHLLELGAYKPPLESRDANSHLLLDFNERTIPVNKPVVSALQHFLSEGRLQQYPAYGDIVKRLADYAGVDSDQMMITNGSDQGIDLVFRAVVKPQSEAIIPGPSFAMYDQCARVESMKIVAPLYSKDTGFPLASVLAAINPNTAIIVIANPNNPSGTLVDQAAITAVAEAAPQAAVLIDECYYEYSRATSVALLQRYNNLFITRTFSKTWGIPSLRFGYLMAQPDYIAALCSVRGPYDINQLAVVAADAALTNPAYTEDYVKQVMTIAKPAFEQWLEQQGIDYWPSVANFVWAFPGNAESLVQSLAQHGVLVRPKNYNDRVGLRITIGTPEQMQRVVDIWSQFI